MSSGRFIAVVGPSGAGKDSVIDGLIAARPDLIRVQRVITRSADAGGEVHDAVSPALFAARQAGGDFALSWKAHDLHYGIPASVRGEVSRGRDVVANLSRGVLGKARDAFGTVHVLHVTAQPEVLAKRLRARGRESYAAIERRLSRPVPDFPQGLIVTEIDNSQALDRAVAQALDALYPARV